MYLSRLSLDLRNGQARRDWADPYEMHRSLVRCFVSGTEQSVPRFLWRLEPPTVGETERAVLLLQSEQAPDFSGAGLGGDYLHGSPKSKAVSLEKLLVEGACYRFRLVANPTVARAGRRLGLVGEGDQLAWLSRQGARHGFAVSQALVVSGDYIKSRRKGALMSLLRVHFEGLLRARDTSRLREALLAGIGPGKAFGCGLLSLVRA